MKELILSNGEFTMTSLEVVELINRLRAEEGNETKKEHKEFMKSIRKEIDALQSLGIFNEGNFSLVEYTDKKGEKRPCYILSKQAIMQMLNKESVYVRYKTQQYIEALEEKLTLSDRDKARLKILNAKSDVERIDGIKELEEVTYNEGYEIGYDDGMNKAFEGIKNNRITPLASISDIAKAINVSSLNGGALNWFLVSRGLGSLELITKNYKFRPNDNFEKAIIENGWAKYTNLEKTSFKFYMAFADFINENMDYYLDSLTKAKEGYNSKVMKNKENNLPF